jgi:hypothetical protein
MATHSETYCLAAIAASSLSSSDLHTASAIALLAPALCGGVDDGRTTTPDANGLFARGSNEGSAGVSTLLFFGGRGGGGDGEYDGDMRPASPPSSSSSSSSAHAWLKQQTKTCAMM